MNLLLDTCTFLWLVAQPKRLSRRARAAIDREATRLYLSDVSIFEVCTKWRSGRLELPTTPRRWFGEQTRLWHTERLPLDVEHYLRESELPALHRDPFDRLLVAQAVSGPFTLLSADAAFAAYGCPLQDTRA